MKPPCRRHPRRGVATVEAAVCLPVLVAIAFGAIQACDTVHLQHVATLAAYEGTLAAGKESATQAEVVARAQNLLTALRIRGGTVRLDPPVDDLTDLDPGTALTVTVTIPVGSNLTGPSFFAPISQVTARGAAIR